MLEHLIDHPAFIPSLSHKALDAFWTVVVQHCPEATNGDLSISRTVALNDAACEAISEWIANNQPVRDRARRF